jgi:hypothetical protein
MRDNSHVYLASLNCRGLKKKTLTNSGSKFGKQYSDYWTKRVNAKSRNRIEKMKRRTRESIVQNTIRLMTTTASDIAGPSEEVVLENEAGND